MTKKDKITPRTLSGFMELPPREQLIFDEMLERVRASFSLYGFTPLDTPVIELAEILLAKAGGETEKQIYRFNKGENDLALRFDLTVPLAKYVAKNYGQLSFPFKRFQIGKSYRGERAQRGRFREFYQCDIDTIGDGTLGIMNEAEILSVIYNTFTSLGLTGFVIRINNRKVFNGLFNIFGLGEKAPDIMRVIDKLEKTGADKALETLISGGIDPKTAKEIVDVVTTEENALVFLEQYAGRNEMFDTGLSELREVTRYLNAFNVPEEFCRIDLKIARGLDYYTGTVYETFITKHPEIGSICSGGRYDDLAGFYTDKKLPGVGTTIGLTRLFYVLNEQGYINPELPSYPADVLILPMTEDYSVPVQLASQLRSAGIRTMLYAENKKFKAKMAYADKLGVPYIAIIGEDEIASGRITVRDMRTGSQTTASAALLIQGIREKIYEAKNVPVIAAKL